MVMYQWREIRDKKYKQRFNAPVFFLTNKKCAISGRLRDRDTCVGLLSDR